MEKEQLISSFQEIRHRAGQVRRGLWPASTVREDGVFRFFFSPGNMDKLFVEPNGTTSHQNAREKFPKACAAGIRPATMATRAIRCAFVGWVERVLTPIPITFVAAGEVINRARENGAVHLPRCSRRTIQAEIA